MKLLDKLNPLIWALWLIMKVMRLSQKIPVWVYYGFAIVLMIVSATACIIELLPPLWD